MDSPPTGAPAPEKEPVDKKPSGFFLILEPCPEAVSTALQKISERENVAIHKDARAEDLASKLKNVHVGVVVVMVASKDDIVKAVYLTKAVRAASAKKQIAIVVCSSIKSDKLSTMLFKLGAREYLQLPIAPQTLQFKIRILIQALIKRHEVKSKVDSEIQHIKKLESHAKEEKDSGKIQRVHVKHEENQEDEEKSKSHEVDKVAEGVWRIKGEKGPSHDWEDHVGEEGEKKNPNDITTSTEKGREIKKHEMKKEASKGWKSHLGSESNEDGSQGQNAADQAADEIKEQDFENESLTPDGVRSRKGKKKTPSLSESEAKTETKAKTGSRKQSVEAGVLGEEDEHDDIDLEQEEGSSPASRKKLQKDQEISYKKRSKNSKETSSTSSETGTDDIDADDEEAEYSTHKKTRSSTGGPAEGNDENDLLTDDQENPQDIATESVKGKKKAHKEFEINLGTGKKKASSSVDDALDEDISTQPVSPSQAMEDPVSDFLKKRAERRKKRAEENKKQNKDLKADSQQKEKVGAGEDSLLHPSARASDDPGVQAVGILLRLSDHIPSKKFSAQDVMTEVLASSQEYMGCNNITLLFRISDASGKMGLIASNEEGARPGEEMAISGIPGFQNAIGTGESIMTSDWMDGYWSYVVPIMYRGSAIGVMIASYDHRPEPDPDLTLAQKVSQMISDLIYHEGSKLFKQFQPKAA